METRNVIVPGIFLEFYSESVMSVMFDGLNVHVSGEITPDFTFYKLSNRNNSRSELSVIPWESSRIMFPYYIYEDTHLEN